MDTNHLDPKPNGWASVKQHNEDKLEENRVKANGEYTPDSTTVENHNHRQEYRVRKNSGMNNSHPDIHKNTATVKAINAKKRD